MTEDKWLSGKELWRLVRVIRREKSWFRPPVLKRKLRLFGCACLRSDWEKLPDDKFRVAISTAEDMADGNVTERQVEWARDDVAHTMHWLKSEYAGPCLALLEPRISELVGELSDEVWPFRNAVAIPLLRDIFGNPFRPVAFDPRWRSESAVALARTAYDTRNFTLLPILADALEEAGCDHADVLSHCRQPDGVHVRGCWVVDGVLGM